ncbi:MAG: hypothetical protein Q9188_007250 [Gyalolechia gomerana]
MSDKPFSMMRLVERVRDLTTSKRKPKKRSPFLNLPPELRHQIYRELLCSRKVYRLASDDGVARRYEYQVAILRCNRQINAEATPVLYRDNCLLFFELDWFCKDEVLRLLVRPLFKDRLICDEAACTLRQRAAVHVRVTSDPWKWPGAGKDLFVITPWELHMTTQRLWISLQTEDLVKIWSCDLRFQLLFKHEMYRHTLIDGLIGLRGPKPLFRGKVRGLEPSVARVMSETFETRTRHISECIVRASAFESRGDLLLESADRNDEFLAYKTFSEGATYIGGIFQQAGWYLNFRDHSIERVRLLIQKQSWMNYACALYLINNGPLDYGLISLDACFTAWPTIRDPIILAKWKYYYGRVLLEHRYEMQAIYYLMVALRLRPVFPAVRNQARELERRMRLMPPEKAKEVSEAFRLVLKPILDHGNRELTMEEYNGRGESEVGEEIKLAREITKVDGFVPDMIQNGRYRAEESADLTGLMPKVSM